MVILLNTLHTHTHTQTADNRNILEGVVIVVHKKLSSRKGTFILRVHVHVYIAHT